MYDKYGRGIYYLTTNHMGAFTKQESKLDFIGKPEFVITEHQKDANQQTIRIKDSFTYTAQDLLLTHTHQIGLPTPQLLRKNEYDALGHLVRKLVGSADDTGIRALQKIDYRYNIRGWLTHINDYENLQQDGNPKDLFAFKISYNTIQNNIRI